MTCHLRLGTAARCGALLAFCLAGVQGRADEPATAEGLTEPYKTIRVASPESGILESLAVAEGDRVRQGELIATLDSEVHETLLAIAEWGMRAEGQRRSAVAELEMRQARLEKLRILFDKGHARREELDRAEADYAIAQGNVQTVDEELELKRLEHARILAQIHRRKIRAPLDGTITQVLKQRGEFVAPIDPVIVELVQLNPLLATFMTSRAQADSLEIGQQVTVAMADSDGRAVGEVSYVSPTTDAESGLVRVKVKLKNDDRRLRSGERCTLLLPE